ncbi:sodium/glutamate symporter [Psychromonas sp. RZ22]|nr:sodium/glutamate symporter [Psychromonas sp. RZ22]
MSVVDGVLNLSSFFTVTMGIIVLFVGRRINRSSKLLQEFSIPEPVTGGLLFSIIFSLLFLFMDIEIKFDLTARDILLVYFFTTIGINASFRDLLRGGKPLLILLFITIAYMIIQNLTGMSVAHLFSLDPAVGLLGGSISLIGGHGTAIAWSPRIAQEYGIHNAMEIAIASATFGLILASLMGGPIAKYLITRNNLKAEKTIEAVSEKQEKVASKGINSFEFLDAIFAIHICIIFGSILNEVISEMGLKLPLFVTCLFAGIVITNSLPKKKRPITETHWPTGSPAISLIADIALGTFLAMSLMSMQLWTLVDLAGPIFAILAAQFIIAILVNLFIVFPAMGRNYNAAVVCAGFGGISLGATPTAMANMSAVSQKYGYSKQAFIIVPLVCAFFIDLVNAMMIPFFLNHFA